MVRFVLNLCRIIGKLTHFFIIDYLCCSDCDSDDDCFEGLRCFQRDSRNALEPVPGCVGEGIPRKDYCYLPGSPKGTTGKENTNPEKEDEQDIKEDDKQDVKENENKEENNEKDETNKEESDGNGKDDQGGNGKEEENENNNDQGNGDDNRPWLQLMPEDCTENKPW